MADFCNKCAQEMWDKGADPDIDVYKIAEELEPNHFESVLCEGCGVRAIGKRSTGEIVIGLLLEEGAVEDMVKWVSLEEWEQNQTAA